MIAFIGLAGIGYLCFVSLPSVLAPAEDMGAFLIKITPPPNASFAYLDDYSKKVESMLKHIPGVQSVMMTDNIDQGGFGFVILKPLSLRHESQQQIMREVIEQSQKNPGAKVAAFNMSTLGGGGRSGDSVAMQISTDSSYQNLHSIAENFIEKVKNYPGISSSDQDLEMNNTQYVVTINRNLAAALQVNVSDINDTLKTMLGGSVATRFNWDSRDYDVMLQISQHRLQNLAVINQLYVRSAAGQMIPLSSLASVKQVVGPQELPHENRLRADTVEFQLTPGTPMGSAIHYLQETAKNTLPDGVQFRFSGVAKRMLDSKHTMAGSLTLAIIFIYLVLAAQFESFIDPFIIMLTVPVSIVGALLTLKLTGNSLSIYTNIGFVTLIGLIAKHGILITEFANQKRRQGVEMMKAIVEAATLRLRPILMTTAAMVIGAVPLVLAGGAGAISRHHIGWVIVGGLLFGTFFSLIVVPVAYSYLAKRKRVLVETPDASRFGNH